MHGMKPSKIYSCSDRVQADMLIEALKREGIPAYAESKGSGDYLNIYMGTSVFGETIYVDEGDAERAKEIIESMTQTDSSTDTVEDKGSVPARPDKKILVVRIISLIAALFLFLGAVVPTLLNLFLG